MPQSQTAACQAMEQLQRSILKRIQSLPNSTAVPAWCFSCVCSICACFGLSVSSSSSCLVRAAVCDCGTPWTVLLPLPPFLYCLLGIRPLEQELDLRRLTLLADVLYIDGMLEQDMVMRQVSVKDLVSHSWFVSCNDRLHKYSLPNIYTVRQMFASEAEFKQQVKSGIDRYVKDF